MKKGLKTLIAGIVVFIMGVFIVPAAVLLAVVSHNSEDRQFEIPRSGTVEVDKAGQYYLWNDYQTVFEGRTFNRSRDLPDGLEIRIVDESGKVMDFHSDASLSTSSGGSARSSIGYVEVGKPGIVRISVAGDTDPRVFSFSQSVLLKMFGMIFGLMAVTAISVLAGIGLTIWGIVKMASDKKPVV